MKRRAISLMFPYTRLLILQLSKSCIGGFFMSLLYTELLTISKVIPTLMQYMVFLYCVYWQACLLRPLMTWSCTTKSENTAFYSSFLSHRSVLSTSWRPIHRSKSHFKETWGSMVIIGVTGGISSSVETNAVDQWRLRLVFIITGRLVTKIIICCIIGHLRDTVKTLHKGRLEWNYG